MKRSKYTLFILITLTLSVFPIGLFTFVRAQPSVVSSNSEVIDDYIGVDWRSGLAGDILMPEISEELLADVGGLQMANSPDIGAGLQTSEAQVGDVVYDWLLEAETDGLYPYMTLRAIVGNAEIWVANNLMFEPGDPRNDAYNLTITDEMINYLVDEFNDIIYPTDTNNFGIPADRDGTDTIFEYLGWDPMYYDWTDTDNPQRTMIKVYNIRDTNYWNPDYPYYVVGFFADAYNYYYNRNIIHIDAWRWWQRVGDEGTHWFPERPDLEVTRPYVYESTIAHEYQHLIHADYQPAPATFMNEGCSMYAEFLCGYGIEDNYFNTYFATPDNSLTIWGDQGDINILADYGVVALWTIYLSDHYGGTALIKHYVQSGITGIEGINTALADFGYKKDFYDIYHDWRLANLIRSNYPGHGKYNYKSIDITALDPVYMHSEVGLPVSLKRGTDYGSTITILGYDTGVKMVGPCGSDYIEFSNWWKLGRIYFNGDDEAYLGWQPIPDGFWSAFGDEQDKFLLAEAYVDPENPTLTLVTKYNIEEYWDFGFIQVWNETSEEWVSLENEDYTTYDHDPAAYPAIVAELPGLTGESPGWETDEWTTMNFDLTGFEGQTVLISFRYMTDWSTTGDGWFIHEASVSGVPVTLNYESGPSDFLVTPVYAIEVCKHTIYIPSWDMKLSDLTYEGTILALTTKNVKLILIISPTMELGFTDYSFSAQRFHSWIWWF